MSATTVSDRVVYEETSKKRRYLAQDIKALRCRIRFNPERDSKGGVPDDILRSSDGDLNLLNANRNDEGRWLNAYYDNPDNRWNRENGFAFVLSQLSSFLPRLYGGGVLFYDLTAPAAEHLTSLF